MIQLFQWPSQGKLPNSGVFCMKLESYLRFMKIDHKVVSTTSMSESPKRTMPYVKIDGVYQSDSRLIIERLDSKMITPIDQHLSPEQRALSTAYIGMLEKHLVPIMIYYRWYAPKGWDQFSRLIFSGAPSLVRIMIGGLMRRGTLKRLHASGLSRHTESEIYSFAKEDIESLAFLLGKKQFAFGDRLSLLDLVLFSVIGNILYGNVEMPLIAEIQRHQQLVDHAERVLNLVYQKSFA